VGVYWLYTCRRQVCICLRRNTDWRALYILKSAPWSQLWS
jgi:hypothetical protein